MPVLHSRISTHNNTKILAYKVYDCYKKVHEITIHKGWMKGDNTWHTGVTTIFINLSHASVSFHMYFLLIKQNKIQQCLS